MTIFYVALNENLCWTKVLLPFCALMRPTARRSAITLITLFQLCSRKMELIVPFRCSLRLMKWNKKFSIDEKEDVDEDSSSAEILIVPRDRNFYRACFKTYNEIRNHIYIYSCGYYRTKSIKLYVKRTLSNSESFCAYKCFVHVIEILT